jgi:hypothetical protein
VGQWVDSTTPGKVSWTKKYYTTPNNKNIGYSVHVEYPLTSIIHSSTESPTLYDDAMNVKKGKYANLNLNIPDAMRIFKRLRQGEYVKAFYPGKISRIVDDVVEVEYRNPVALVPTQKKVYLPPVNSENTMNSLTKKLLYGGRKTRKMRSLRKSRKTRSK